MVAKTVQGRKSKGRALQQETVKFILDEFVDLTIYDVWSTSMGASGIDVKLSQQARDMFPFGIECKRKESINVPAEFIQARTNAHKEHLYPLLVHRRNREKALVTLELETFMTIVGALYVAEIQIAAGYGRKIRTVKEILEEHAKIRAQINEHRSVLSPENNKDDVGYGLTE